MMETLQSPELAKAPGHYKASKSGVKKGKPTLLTRDRPAVLTKPAAKRKGTR